MCVSVAGRSGLLGLPGLAEPAPRLLGCLVLGSRLGAEGKEPSSAHAFASLAKHAVLSSDSNLTKKPTRPENGAWAT